MSPGTTSRRGAGRVAAALLACLAGAAAGPAAAGWSLKRAGGPRILVEGTSEQPGGRLRLYCEEGEPRLLYVPPRSWNGAVSDLSFAILVDERRVPVSLDFTDEGALLSNRPKDALGITHDLLSALRTGRSLRLEGPMAAQVPPGQRSFALAGAAAHLERLATACPR